MTDPLLDTRHPDQTVTLNGLEYLVARQRGTPGAGNAGPLAFEPRMIRTQDGDPRLERSVRYRDWGRGMGAGREIQGAVHWAVGVHLPTGRIEMGPEIHALAIPNTAAGDEVLDIEPNGRFLWVACGRRIHRVDLSNDGVTSSAQLGGAVRSIQLWRGVLFAALGDGADYAVNPANNVTAGTHAWADNAFGEKAECFGLSRTSGARGASLVRGRENMWSRFEPDAASGISGVWGTEYAIGSSSTILRVFEHEHWDLLLKPDGLYTFDGTSEASNVLGDLRHFASSENRYAFPWHNRLFVCTVAGLVRVILNAAQRPVGIERSRLNEIHYDNPTAGVGFGRVLYEARRFGSKTAIMQYEIAEQGDATDSPFTPTSIVDVVDGQAKAMTITRYDGETRLWFGNGRSIRYFQLSPSGAPVERRDETDFSASTDSSIEDAKPAVALPPTFLDTPDTLKRLRKMEFITEGDGYLRVDVAGEMLGGANGARVNSGRVELYFPKALEGQRRIKPVVKFRNSATEKNPSVIECSLYYWERPLMVPGAVMALRLRDDETERRDAAQKRSDIEALVNAGPVQFTNPWGETYDVIVGDYEGDIQWQLQGQPPVPDALLTVRRVDYS